MPNFLDKIIDFMKPKAHDAIDAITERWEESQSSPLAQLPPEHEELIQNLVMGTMGGGGGKGLRQLVLALKGKIKGGKMIPSQPIRKGVIGKGKLSEYKELADEYDYVGLAHPERADEIISIFQKQFGNKNASKVLDILLKETRTPNPSKLDILLNKLKDNPNIGGNINRAMLENIKKYKPKK